MNEFINELCDIFNEKELVIKLHDYFRPLVLLIKTKDRSIFHDITNNKQICAVDTLLADLDENIMCFAKKNKLMKFYQKQHYIVNELEYDIKYLEIIDNFIVISDHNTIRLIDIKTEIVTLNFAYIQEK